MRARRRYESPRYGSTPGLSFMLEVDGRAPPAIPSDMETCSTRSAARLSPASTVARRKQSHSEGGRVRTFSAGIEDGATAERPKSMTAFLAAIVEFVSVHPHFAYGTVFLLASSEAM